jgi:lactate dehydrogenase-like 2-hydroxyacid dehydrogenase
VTQTTTTHEGCWAEAYEIGLHAIDRCTKEIEQTPENLRDALAALLTVTAHAAYAMAPSQNGTDEIAERMIAWAQETARQNWAEEKREGYAESAV